MEDSRNDPSCHNCKFWASNWIVKSDSNLPHDIEATMPCRRNAPKPFRYETESMAEEADKSGFHELAMWPKTDGLEWCGEYVHYRIRS